LSQPNPVPRTAGLGTNPKTAPGAVLEKGVPAPPSGATETVTVSTRPNFFTPLLLLYLIQAKSQGMKQLMAGGGVALIGMQLVPLLADLFEAEAGAVLTSTITSAYAVASTAVTEGAVALACAAPKITEIVTILPLHIFAM